MSHGRHGNWFMDMHADDVGRCTTSDDTRTCTRFRWHHHDGLCDIGATVPGRVRVKRGPSSVGDWCRILASHRLERHDVLRIVIRSLPYCRRTIFYENRFHFFAIMRWLPCVNATDLSLLTGLRAVSISPAWTQGVYPERAI